MQGYQEIFSFDTAAIVVLFSLLICMFLDTETMKMTGDLFVLNMYTKYCVHAPVTSLLIT